MNYREPAVRLRQLDVIRGKQHVLHGLNLDIPPGQIVGLLGPSGSGKTTLMRVIVGVQIVQCGEATVLGQPAGSPELRKRVGYLTQAPSVYPDLTVRENLTYFARIADAPRGAVDAAIESVDMTKHADDAVHRLSGGEVSRVSLAATLIGNPDLLVLDEPTVGLDPVLRRDLWNLFADLAAQQGKTLLVSSHVMDEATHCDRLILMRDGRVIADDTLPHLLQSTETASAEEAFLAIVEKQGAA
ncbi:MAG: ABC transporter ATP-binding protein [Bifidobacteriaceae bacterium]|jgi:ABC-2 type transport system ATP-binding protein|nr:ABC transporter ATP-binding protein [Bifidobacteriaceae bacterium]